MTLADIFSSLGEASDELQTNTGNLFSYLYNEVHFGWYIAAFIALGISISIKEWLEEHESVLKSIIKIIRIIFITFLILFALLVIAVIIINVVRG